jgi:L-iditol 2-dehydrogenase
VRINSDIEAAEAAMTEPLGCILHSSAMVEAARTRYRLNAINTERRVRSVLICGAGPAGLLFTQYLRNVVGFDGLLLVSEPNERKRELARGFGADTINPNEVDLSNAVKDRTGGRSVEYLIEASGSGGVFALLPRLIRKQATVLLYGHGHAGVDLSVLNNLMFKEPMLVTPAGASGGFDVDGRPTTYRQSLHLIESRRVDVKSCITHRYTSLDSLNRVFTGEAQKPDYIKGVVML